MVVRFLLYSYRYLDNSVSKWDIAFCESVIYYLMGIDLSSFNDCYISFIYYKDSSNNCFMISP